jgi:DtxR family transcriptional regulator, Mn-dependent transcriptional regulator
VPIVSDLIDTTEMYLRTIFELEEEGIVPLRARIAERLGQSGPTVSETVARMERDGLVVVSQDRHLELTARGRGVAVRVMRKHRLAECMLVSMLQLPWELVHEEACRWEHVMSEAVEERIFEQLGRPVVSPYGNPIPGLDELTADVRGTVADLTGLSPLPEVLGDDPRTIIVRRLAETIQTDQPIMSALRLAGVTPNAHVQATLAGDHVVIGNAGESVEIPIAEAAHILVDADA